MSKTDRTGDFDLSAVYAEWMRVLDLISRGRPQDIAFLNLCCDEFKRQRNTKGKRWGIECGETYANAYGGPQYAAHFAAVLFAVMRRMYGGETIWQNKRPRDALLIDAKRMTPDELRKKHGISRSYSYVLRRESLRRK